MAAVEWACPGHETVDLLVANPCIAISSGLIVVIPALIVILIAVWFLWRVMKHEAD